MRARDIFSYAFSAIRLRKLRAGLTTLGVVIGIAAIVALLSLGQGFQDAITAQFQKGFATNTLIVSPRGLQGESSYQLFVNDTKTIENNPNVTSAVPILQKTVYATVGGRTFLTNVAGVNFSQYMNVYSSTFVAQEGSIPSNPENESIVIGARIHDPWQNGTILANVGDNVEINWTVGFPRRSENYTGHIDAVLAEVGGFSLGGPSDLGIYIPIQGAEHFFNSSEVNSIIVQLKDSEDATIESTSDAIRNAFGGQVSVTSSTAVLSTIETIFSVIELFLAGIAGISLLVAGIGIMNIMIVSLMERTREIGILKALGMKGRTVLLIFLGEAMIIGILGAAIGIGLGLGLAEVVSRVGFAAMGQSNGGAGIRPRAAVSQSTNLTISPILTPSVFVGAFAFGLLVSVVFALYPAWRASKLKPVDALRYE
jgi:putative ABC transport system permease protein